MFIKHTYNCCEFSKLSFVIEIKCTRKGKIKAFKIIEINFFLHEIAFQLPLSVPTYYLIQSFGYFEDIDAIWHHFSLSCNRRTSKNCKISAIKTPRYISQNKKVQIKRVVTLLNQPSSLGFRLSAYKKSKKIYELCWNRSYCDT